MPLGTMLRSIRRRVLSIRPSLRPFQVVVVLLLLATGFAAAAGVVHNIRGDQRQQREAWARSTASDLGGELDSAEGALNGLRGLFAASPQGVDSAAFTRFATVAFKSVSTQSVSWAPRVSAADRASFEGASGRPILDALPSGAFQPAPARAEYFPLSLVAPRTDIAQASVGIDIATSAPLRPSLAAARDGGRPVVTSALQLGANRRPEAVAVLAAVYGPDPAPASILARRAGLRGYLGGLFNISHLVRSPLALLPAGSRLEIVSPAAQIFDSGSGPMPDAVAEAPVGDSGWTARVSTPHPEALWALPVILLIGGSVAVALLVGVLFAQSNLRHREREEVHELLIREADTDGLTGLFNRRRLERDLEEAIAAADWTRPLALMLLDLNGFKAYNDRFGHPAGDALLVRISARLVAAIPGGRVYRLGGDEFCVLASLAPAALKDAVAAARDALTQRGEGFQISGAHGVALVPEDASSPEAAMLVADARMYARKTLGRQSAGSQSVDVLVRALAERSSGLSDHVGSVSDLADRVARRLGLDDPERGRVRRAALLHDIGKIAVPDAILGKPDSLDAAELDFIHRHTLIGERILRAAPALEPIAPLVRSSHERWDGKGYPDGLSGEQIPLGSRIVFVCDAYEAMTSRRRAYHSAVSQEVALAELAACSGTQFDPLMVTTLTAILRDDPTGAVPAVDAPEDGVTVGASSTSRRAPDRRG